MMRRSRIKDGKPVYRLSVNDFIVKAVEVAFQRVPQCNSQWLEKEGVLRTFSYVDVSVAVATDVGLITPIVRGVQSKGVCTISEEVKVLGKKARDGKSDPPTKSFSVANDRLKPEEYMGGTFTISNPGMFESIENFTAIVLPPKNDQANLDQSPAIMYPRRRRDKRHPHSQRHRGKVLLDRPNHESHNVV
jgi:pyruvate dehydrogenase E2 component (dihydrolipoamide acetyltransferase)